MGLMKLWLSSIMTSGDGLWCDTEIWCYHKPSSRAPQLSRCTFLILSPPSDTLNVHGSVKATCISRIETDTALKLQTDTKCGDSGGLDSGSLFSLVTSEDPRPLIGCHWPRPMASINPHRHSLLAAVWDHCATVVSASVLAPKMLQISNPRPEWSWYDHHILILSICLHYFVPTNTNKYQKDILDPKKCILMDKEQLFIVRKEIFLLKWKYIIKSVWMGSWWDCLLIGLATVLVITRCRPDAFGMTRPDHAGGQVGEAGVTAADELKHILFRWITQISPHRKGWIMNL